MGNHHILRFRFVHGLAIFLAGGLGVEDQQNGLRQVPTHSMLFIFVGLGQRGRLPIKTTNI